MKAIFGLLLTGFLALSTANAQQSEEQGKSLKLCGGIFSVNSSRDYYDETHDYFMRVDCQKNIKERPIDVNFPIASIRSLRPGQKGTITKWIRAAAAQNSSSRQSKMAAYVCMDATVDHNPCAENADPKAIIMSVNKMSQAHMQALLDK